MADKAEAARDVRPGESWAFDHPSQAALEYLQVRYPPLSADDLRLARLLRRLAGAIEDGAAISRPRLAAYILVGSREDLWVLVDDIVEHRPV